MKDTIQSFLTNLGINWNNLKLEKESQEYWACRFTHDGQKVLFRKAKITPTKIGQFVTCWKRNDEGKTQAIQSTDDLDRFIICCEFNKNQGYFSFPKDTLIKHGIISTSTKKGKMGIRVYPSWDKADNPQAMKSQKWMLKYFNCFDKIVDQPQD
jgi:hypothetical protein